MGTLLSIARELSGIPLLAGDNIAPYVTTMLLHCLRLWCYLVQCYPQHTILSTALRVNKALARPAPSLVLLISSFLLTTEYYKVNLMSSSALAFHWLCDFISLAVCFNDDTTLYKNTYNTT